MAPNDKKPVYAGLSINRQRVELAVFSSKTHQIDQSVSEILPPDVFDADGDQIRNPIVLKAAIGNLLKAVKVPQSKVHLSIPGTLLRMVELPKIDKDGLYIALSSEAERYRSFDGSEAVVDFSLLTHERPGHQVNAQQQTVVFGGVRSDTLNQYLKLLKELKIKPVSIGLEPVNTLRALAATGVLDGMVQDIGVSSFWGSILVEPTRVRMMIWRGNLLIELRETAIDTSQIGEGNADYFIVEDLLEEVRRTSRTCQPVLWLSSGMPDSIRKALAEKAGCQIYNAVAGEGLGVNNISDLNLATIGAATASLVSYPFECNMVRGAAHMGESNTFSPAKADNSPISVGDDGGGMDSLMKAGLASIGLSIAASIVLGIMGFSVGQQIPGLTSKKDSTQLEVSSLEMRRQELKRKAELDQSLMVAVQNARIRNQVYIALTNDLKHKTPQQIWIQDLKAGDMLEVEGKGMNQDVVIHFAQSFDDAPYLKAVLIKAIKEEQLAGNIVYDFKIGGGVKLTPALLPEETAQQNPPTPEGENMPSSNRTGAYAKPHADKPAPEEA